MWPLPPPPPAAPKAPAASTGVVGLLVPAELPDAGAAAAAAVDDDADKEDDDVEEGSRTCGGGGGGGCGERSLRRNAATPARVRSYSSRVMRRPIACARANRSSDIPIPIPVPVDEPAAPKVEGAAGADACVEEEVRRATGGAEGRKPGLALGLYADPAPAPPVVPAPAAAAGTGEAERFSAPEAEGCGGMSSGEGGRPAAAGAVAAAPVARFGESSARAAAAVVCAALLFSPAIGAGAAAAPPACAEGGSVSLRCPSAPPCTSTCTGARPCPWLWHFACGCSSSCCAIRASPSPSPFPSPLSMFSASELPCASTSTSIIACSRSRSLPFAAAAGLDDDDDGEEDGGAEEDEVEAASARRISIVCLPIVRGGIVALALAAGTGSLHARLREDVREGSALPLRGMDDARPSASVCCTALHQQVRCATHASSPWYRPALSLLPLLSPCLSNLLLQSATVPPPCKRAFFALSPGACACACVSALAPAAFLPLCAAPSAAAGSGSSSQLVRWIGARRDGDVRGEMHRRAPFFFALAPWGCVRAADAMDVWLEGVRLSVSFLGRVASLSCTRC